MDKCVCAILEPSSLNLIKDRSLFSSLISVLYRYTTNSHMGVFICFFVSGGGGLQLTIEKKLYFFFNIFSFFILPFNYLHADKLVFLLLIRKSFR